MSYRKVYFRIQTENYASGWSSDADRSAFKEESRRLFQELGWSLDPGGNGVCDTVTKDRQDLYLHPTSFSGVMNEANIQSLQEQLSKARIFQSTPPVFPTQINKDNNQITNQSSTDSFPFPSAPPAPAAKPKGAKGKRHGRRKSISQSEMDDYREMIQENICYDDFMRERPYDAAQLDEMVELMVEAVCSRKETIRVAGNDFPQAVVKSRLLKLDGQHIRFVFDCLRENTTQVRNMKQYLLTVLYNAPTTIENHVAAQVNHDLYGKT